MKGGELPKQLHQFEGENEAGFLQKCGEIISFSHYNYLAFHS